MSAIVLYSTLGCHLCEEAKALLVCVAPQLVKDLREVDIADDDALLERYGVRIPVLMQAETGNELDWPFDQLELRDFLDPLDQD